MTVRLLNFRFLRKFAFGGIVMTFLGWLLYTSYLSTNNSTLHRNLGEFFDVGPKQTANISMASHSDELALTSLSEIRKLRALRKLVGNRNVRALEKLGKLSAERKNFRYVIVAQIHNRLAYIRALLDSLAGTHNISDALVIFSHDVVDEQIDNFVWDADTTFEIVQIYFPHSLQLHPNEFPGPSALDCPDRISKAEAASLRCNNHDHPDSYGHYRTAKVTQIKHHWWWKFHVLFNHVPWAQNGLPVIFLEEDHYVLPDALSILDRLLAMRDTACAPKCPVLSIGHHKTKLTEEPNAYRKYFVEQWAGARDNIGIVFDFDHYKAINSCASIFCTVDDYNWDWSLNFLTDRCLKKEYKMLLPLAPRVLHIGDCGGLHHSQGCNPRDSVRKAKETVSAVETQLFPDKLEKITSESLPKLRNPKPNGGWGDPRDIELCQNVSQSFRFGMEHVN
ncbi:alpha-1,6-mannosyl-glycoprotein 2-beta-N-acetylglucosaminyltransferase-like [Paramacrobiotus metropolitanus]|uniref:alpha-1,6-mannosyl-glycoprotein 2-beta-N-acetylglucosaminyltransferase-like n=1 Tax=Paramacrobiotus metropolitanus TaxID=2943436 RepID=UPI0024457D70|nr:alpha-1,6-mannosyl-glycoprotein 2-beta-N-acetylglucosaminyltransferase-like [Paramacrobiotus metropolitanus]XP_055331665.1 alpha-1,6-mannosyl-glycoprotein 2-beta-N-acetylglucosaminyltransferase-like [Paramacrobiotus metropolitanus]XP_055331666.1 alpha-1,6-mannosyl-glycoprotein 2-beta-N-acetylglucosaminyltransferase-like [Paramacrobiotus metropolitanus]